MLSNAYTAWLESGNFGFMLVVALFLTLDAITGFSRRWSAARGLPKGGDRALLVAMAVVAVLAWSVQRGLEYGFAAPYGKYPAGLPLMAYVDYIRILDHYGQPVKNAEWASWIYREVYMPRMFQVSILVCPVIAWFKWRSAPQWLALGFLGGAGAIIWLLLAPRQTDSVLRRAGSDETQAALK